MTQWLCWVWWVALSCIDHVVVIWCNYCDTRFGQSENLNKFLCCCICSGASWYKELLAELMIVKCKKDSWIQTRAKKKVCGWKSEKDFSPFTLLKCKCCTIIWILSNSRCQNCISPPLFSTTAKPQRNQILWIAILVQTFSLPQIMAHLLRGGVCTWHTMPPGRLRLRKCARNFLASVPNFFDRGRSVVAGSAF